MKGAHKLGPLADFAITLSFSLVLFVLAFLWFRFSELPQRAFYSAIGKEESAEWSIRLTKYLGTTFIIACGIGILVLAINEATKLLCDKYYSCRFPACDCAAAQRGE